MPIMTDEERAKHICDGLGLPREARASFVTEFAVIRQAERERLARTSGDQEALADQLAKIWLDHDEGCEWPIIAAFIAALIGAEREKQAWRPIETAPKDGTAVWAYLYESGVRLVRYVSPEELARDGGGEPAEYVVDYWVEVENESENWSPLYWLPRDTLPDAPPASADTGREG